MEKEIKDLIVYMKEKREVLKGLYDERLMLLNEKNAIEDTQSGFYIDAKSEYDSKVEEYNEMAADVKKVINEKKSAIINRLRKDQRLIDEHRKEYKSEYVELSKMHEEIKENRESLEGAKAHLEWLRLTFPETSEKKEEIISKAQDRVSTCQSKFDESIRVLNLVSGHRTPKEVFIHYYNKIR